MDLPKRKANRLPAYDYSSPGAYFLTVCTKDKRCILGSIVGGGVPDAPKTCLSSAGRIVEQQILAAKQVPGIRVDKYVIMPNHIHLLLFVDGQEEKTVSPANEKIPRFVAGLKRLCNQAAGIQIFQRSYHDHVIRGEKDYRMIWQYIDTNPALWEKDCFYME